MTAPDLLSRAGLRTAGPGPSSNSRSHAAAATWALFAGIGLLMVGNGLQGSLIGVRSQTEGFSTVATGLVMTAYFGGFLAGTRAATAILPSVGHIRAFAALASTASAVTLVHVLAIFPATWVAMRFVTGLCMAGLYVIVESWLNDLATNQTRGRLLAFYMVVSMGGMATGQTLLAAAPPEGFHLFLLASLLVSLSLVPITLSATSSPPATMPVPLALRELAAIAPTGLTVSFLIGISHGALLGMGAAYAAAAGLRPSQIALFMGAPMVGGVAFQIPIGSVSDRVSRRGVMLAVAVAASLCAFALLAVAPGSPASYVLLFLLGGLSFPLYSLAIAYTNDWIGHERILAASSRLVAVNGVGSVLGPPLAVATMLLFGTGSYFMAILVTHLAIAIYLSARILTRDPLPTTRQTRFVPFPARASAVTTNLFARRRLNRRHSTSRRS